MKRVLATLLATFTLAACAGNATEGSEDDDRGAATDVADLSIGDVPDDMFKADGWGSALDCKTIPNLPALPHPEVTISLEGQTLHLVDRTVGYDKVFPVGPGQIDDRPDSNILGESRSYWPVKNYQTQNFFFRPSTNTRCKIWWTDPETGEKSPLFAGLPFMSWSGSYAIHGPIDNFRAPNGGNLRRGFVSHGCVRMEAEAILEVYARIGSVTTPVRVQREPERLSDGTRVDVSPRWVGAECKSDSDCAFAGGFCHRNPYSERGFCTARCTKFCADKAGQPGTFCVPDPDASAGQGMCVAKIAGQNPDCRTFDHFEPMPAQRIGQSEVTADVCLPGSQGAIGDHCFLDADCDAGNRCAGVRGGHPGICTQTCTRTCPDPVGAATTLCVNNATLGGPSCMRTCSPGTNAPECPGGTTCQLRMRNNDLMTTKFVCVP